MTNSRGNLAKKCNSEVVFFLLKHIENKNHDENQRLLKNTVNAENN